MKCFIGIDPGLSGAWAVIDEDSNIVLVRNFRDSSFKDFQEEIYLLSRDMQVHLVALEKVHAMPGQGVTSMFTFGQNFGGWLTALELLSLKHCLVRPQKWQKDILGDVTKGQSKIAALGYVWKRFPEEKIKKSDHGKVDAILLALWAKNFGI
jgi:Holliday junction resolvasome RuvABC endonuclease subunit